MKPFKVSIKGRTWRVECYPEKELYAKFTDIRPPYGAFSDPANHKIVFKDEYREVVPVVHELMHAYMSEMCTGSAELSPKQVEEVMCDVVAENLTDIVDNTRKIMARLKRK